MPCTYHSDHLSIVYPDNWTLEQDEPGSADEVVTVSSPNTAFWTASVYQELLDVHELTSQVLETMRGEYPQLEADPIREEIEDFLLIGHEISFYYVDLVNTAWVLACHHRGRTLLVLCQTEDHELDEVEPVFRAMTLGMLRGVLAVE